MSANTYGLAGTINFGTPVMTGYITEAVNMSQTPGVNEVIMNETGSIVGRRYDDIITKISFNGYYNSPSSSGILSPGSEFTFSSSLYNAKFISEKFDIEWANKASTKFTLEGITSQYLILS